MKALLAAAAALLMVACHTATPGEPSAPDAADHDAGRADVRGDAEVDGTDTFELPKVGDPCSTDEQCQRGRSVLEACIRGECDVCRDNEDCRWNAGHLGDICLNNECKKCDPADSEGCQDDKVCVEDEYSVDIYKCR